jgi:multicomponent Na+:H+ antiporter subunit E
MPNKDPAGGASARAAAVRALGLLAFWILLIGADPGDLAAGALTAVLAAVASVRLFAPSARRTRVGPLAAIALRLPFQSLAAGFDVAWRALHPRLPLRPGYVTHALRTPPGLARDAFCALTSVVPGTVPSGLDARGGLVVHCIDREQPVAQQLAANEARVARALGADLDA